MERMLHPQVHPSLPYNLLQYIHIQDPVHTCCLSCYAGSSVNLCVNIKETEQIVNSVELLFKFLVNVT